MRTGYLQGWRLGESVIALILGFGFFPQIVSAQSQLLDEMVSAVEQGSQVLNIDVAVTGTAGMCSNGQADPSPDNIVRYHAASISKLLTAIVIMQLRDEGMLELTDRIGVYDSNFADSPIQLDQLLTHTSGLKDRRRANGRSTAAEVDSYIKSLASQRVKETPAQWRYADANFNLLGRVIERVTSRSYDDAMRERIFRPLGMTQSEFDLSLTPTRNRAIAFSKRGRARSHPWDLAFVPSSGLQTTADDLIKFADAVLSIRKDSAGALLGWESLKQMTTRRTDTEYQGIGQGLGWQLAQTELGPQWRHAGGEDGFESLLTIYPQSQFAVALLGNQEDWPRFQLERDIRERYMNKEDICASKQGN